MEVHQSISAGLLDSTGTIQVDLACRGCGYNLRGLRPEGACPECGAAIGLSCYGDLLRFAEPGWVDSLARGAALIFWGSIIAIVGVVLSILVSMVTGNQPVAMLVGLAGGAVGFYGAWVITQPDPSGIGEDRYVTDRRVVRITLLLGLLESVIQIVGDSLAVPINLGALIVMAILLSSLCRAVGEFAKLTYFRKLALRIPDGTLAARARTLRMVLTTCHCILALGQAANMLFVPGGLTPVAVPAGGPKGLLLFVAIAAGCLSAVTVLVYVIASIMELVLVRDLRRAFMAQAMLARQMWANADSLESPHSLEPSREK